MSRWETVSCEHRNREVEVIVAVSLLGFFIAIFGSMGASSFYSPTFFALALWGWVVPSVIMTPFIVWRTVTRICAEKNNQCYGNFIWRDIYLNPQEFTLFHVALYVLKAYWPLLNWMCVIAGIVSIARCDFSVRCPYGLSSQR